MKLLSTLWHMPGGMWRGMMASAPFRQWAQFGGIMVLTAFAAWVTWILWLGPWSIAVEGKRADAMFYIAETALGLVLVGLVALNGVGVRFKAGRDGVTGEVDTDPVAPAAPVAVTTTTTETRVEAAP